MKNLNEIIGNKYIKHVEEIDGKKFEFYAFKGYKPIIRELMKTQCYNGSRGCFRFMFIEKNKPKIVCVIRNKTEIETVCFLIHDSWIIGNAISNNNCDLGNLGFFTRNQYRGNGNSHKICKFFERNFSKITNNDGYFVHIQYHVKKAFEKNFSKIKVKELRYGENSDSWMMDNIIPKNPYSIDFKKENDKFVKTCWWK